MPTVVWTLGAATLTFPNGVLGGQALKPGQKFVVYRRSAGGVRYSYNLGATTPLELSAVTFPRITKAKMDEIITWIQSTSVEALNAFTHQDNSMSPAYQRTVFLKDWWFTFEGWADAASPIFSFHAVLEDD
jgi:hypothetical protein